ncbi:hypothetical protein EON63_21680 [archaeon]|nr:MAG: hypothetical protein EON63_21680 [archaeon]
MSYPHTSHCLGDGSIMVSMMGKGDQGAAGGDFLLLSSDLDILGTYANQPTPFGYVFGNLCVRFDALCLWLW